MILLGCLGAKEHVIDPNDPLVAPKALGSHADLQLLGPATTRMKPGPRGRSATAITNQ
jgi:hypothetical protein